MPLHRLATVVPDGVIAVANPITANLVGGSNGAYMTAISVNWLSEPNVTYKVCTSAPTFAVNTAKSAVRCRWIVANGNGAFTNTAPDFSVVAQLMGWENDFCVTPNAAYYGFSAFEYAFGSGATPPTWYSAAFQFWHDVNNQVGFDGINHQNVIPTLKAASDWPFQLWIEKES